MNLLNKKYNVITKWGNIYNHYITAKEAFTCKIWGNDGNLQIIKEMSTSNKTSHEDLSNLLK